MFRYAAPLSVRKCFLILVLYSNNTKRAADTGQVDHGFTRDGGMFKVSTQTTIAAQPPEGPLDDPAARQDGKAFGVGRAAHDVQVPPKLFAYLGDNMLIGTLCPNELADTSDCARCV